MSLYLFLAVLVLCCAYALARGGPPERASALLQLGAFATDEAVHRLVDGRAYAALAVGSALVDLALLLALIVLASRCTRHWPLWVAGWQLAAIVAHLAKLIDPTMQATGYAIELQIWAYPMLLATAAGAWRYHMRRAAGLIEPDWKTLDGRPIVA
ncbi:hypothetical protein QE363_000765 [Sphingomonas sp. SORGH_AS870]|uniref:hypothetical protein n=1 Tax=Sphingomonas sp. SORGH_AS_0870 TaxID=3041801 RepID=UPI0028559D55|nr:hypothetical protein [Sphingomonas sp. SORGH_AS_0870]MDR6144972.1 hypothetical protein [Sphingomonas sp. SORGH_AS_0870]